MDFIDFLAGYQDILPLFFCILVTGSILMSLWMTRNEVFGLERDDWLPGYIISYGIILCMMMLGVLIFYGLAEIGLIPSEEVRFFFSE